MGAYEDKLAQVKQLNDAVAQLDPNVRGEAFALLAPLVGVSEQGAFAKQWGRLKIAGVGLSKAVGFAVAVATGVSVIIAIWFILRPNTEPVTEQTVSIDTVSVTRDVTLGEFLTYPFMRSLPRGVWAFPSQDDPAARHKGGVVNFTFALKGFPREGVNLRWSLFDAETRKLLANSEDHDPFCVYDTQTDPWCVGYSAALRDNEVGSFAFWIDYAVTTVDCAFARVELYRGDNRLTFKDSAAFHGPTSSGAECPAPQSDA